MKSNIKESWNYDDILHLPHPVSRRHPQMSMTERAAQFSPFAALTGYGDVIRETSRFTDRKPELSEEEKAELDYRLRMACGLPGGPPEITITYFVPDKKKDGGVYQKTSGRIRKIDAARHKIILEDGTQIDLDCVLDLDAGI